MQTSSPSSSWKRMISLKDIEQYIYQKEINEVNGQIIFDLNSIIFKEMKKWWTNNISDNNNSRVFKSLEQLLDSCFNEIYIEIEKVIDFFKKNMKEGVELYLYFEQLNPDSLKYKRYQDRNDKLKQIEIYLKDDPTNIKHMQKYFFDSKSQFIERIEIKFTYEKIKYIKCLNMHKTILKKHPWPIIYSDDKDFLLFGAKTMIFNIDIYRRILYMYDWENYLNNKDLTRDQLIKCAILCGTNYNLGLHGFGPKKSEKIVRDTGANFIQFDAKEFKNINKKQQDDLIAAYEDIK